MEFFNNKENDSLKFKINSEGVDMNKVEPRLILTTEKNKNYLFIGEVQNDICRFNLPKLELYEKGDEGKIKFEIISEDLYFPVWEDKFEIKTKANIKIEEMITQINKEEEHKKQVSVKAIFETEKKKEDPEPVKKVQKPIKEHKKEDATPPPQSIKKEEKIKHFNDFFVKR
jgi:hypothetical protein